MGADLTDFDNWMDALAYSHSRDWRHAVDPSNQIGVDEDFTYYGLAELGGQLSQAAITMAIPGPDAPAVGAVPRVIEGTATLSEWLVPTGKHYSVVVRAGDDVLHTHLAVAAGQDTIVRDATRLGHTLVKEAHFSLPDASAALQYQRVC